jgi:hypothetical protein
MRKSISGATLSQRRRLRQTTPASVKGFYQPTNKQLRTEKPGLGEPTKLVGFNDFSISLIFTMKGASGSAGPNRDARKTIRRENFGV